MSERCGEIANPSTGNPPKMEENAPIVEKRDDARAASVSICDWLSDARTTFSEAAGHHVAWTTMQEGLVLRPRRFSGRITIGSM
jgi:hypothetical protein